MRIGAVLALMCTGGLLCGPHRGAQCADEPKRPSGPSWVAAPNRKLCDLDGPFRANFRQFIRTLRKAKVRVVSVESTYRTPEQQFLMHYAFKVAKGVLDPDRDKIPQMPGVPIEWRHVTSDGAYDRECSIGAAQEMLNLWKVVRQPVLPELSRHVKREAVDVTIDWGPEPPAPGKPAAPVVAVPLTLAFDYYEIAASDERPFVESGLIYDDFDPKYDLEDSGPCSTEDHLQPLPVGALRKTKTLTIKSLPNSGMNAELAVVARDWFHVLKGPPDDPPHWSTNGH